MTQAFNLAQLANNLNTSGQLDATDGLNGLVANANLASSGTASSSTFLRGDRTWQAVPTSGRILQSITVTKTDGFTTSSTSWVDITGMSLTITPTASTSKILILTSMSHDNYTNASGIQIVRNGTALLTSTAGSPYVGFFWGWDNNTGIMAKSVSINILDSPATTSALTYKYQLRTYAGNNGYINSHPDGQFGGSSTIIALEIGA